MDTKAAAIIGGGAIIAGLILYIPCHFLAKYFLRRSAPKSIAHKRITTLGLVVYASMVVAMFVGFTQEYFAPHTWFGHFMSNWLGRLTYAAVLATVSTCIEYLLTRRGYVLWVRLPAALPSVPADASGAAEQ
jgi:hypothetical protein